MKRLVISSAVAALIAGGAGLSFAGQPGPNGHNNHGLCTAYFANGGNGNSHTAPPFAQLEKDADAAGDNNGTTDPQEVVDYCAPYLAGNGQDNPNNGNPTAGGHGGH